MPDRVGPIREDFAVCPPKITRFRASLRVSGILDAMTSPLRVAAVQLNCGDDVSANLAKCKEWVSRASDAGAKFVLLPENFAFFGPEAAKRECAESLDGSPGPIREALMRMASDHRLFVMGGGWPESGGAKERPYNASSLFDPSGKLVAHYRKIHLFDVVVPGGVTYEESASTAPGTEVVVADVFGTRFGMSICYDLRFAELYRSLVVQGAQVLCVPAAFTLETGKDHWHLLLRARAVETQCWVIAADQWGSHGKGRNTYGHSVIIDPWGTIVAEASDREGFIVADLDWDFQAQIRKRLPCLNHHRLG
jgi:predicted amidohydrolase